MISVTVLVFLFIVGSLGLAVFDAVVLWAFGCFFLFYLMFFLLTSRLRARWLSRS